MIDYDLVIIGGSAAGRYAAATAAAFNARVALVEQGVSVGEDTLYSRSILHSSSLGESWETAIGRAHRIATTLNQEMSLEALAASGVDVISGCGEFCRLPQQAFGVNHRRLRSRAYLLATGSHVTLPSLIPNAPLNALTPTQLWQLPHLDNLPKEIAILGNSPLALEIAQTLSRFGKTVALAVAEARLLPTEDPEIARWLQAHLEAAGVTLLTNSPITQIQEIDGKPWLQIGDTALEAHCLIFAGDRQACIDGLNLEGVAVNLHQNRLLLNDKLQTSNRQIYACGSLSGGYDLPHVAQAEATVALKNALFWPIFKIDYTPIPWAVFTEPNLAAVGLNEAQARRRYGKDVLVTRHFFKQNAQAIITEANEGFCQLMLRENGQILGARILGKDAAEYIGIISFAMQQNLKIHHLARLSAIAPSLSAILPEAAIACQQGRDRDQPKLKSLRETWYNFRRRWSS
jgi:pyruvate/2-oxoglutarate dehydrogenase complex dihydrolipoamide dehydrogenase (E3) component